MNVLTHINLPIDINYLRNLFDKSNFNEFTYKNSIIENLFISKIENNDYINFLIDFYKLNCRPRFLMIPANANILIHRDHNTKCAINILLDENPCPILFNKEAPFEVYYYNQAIIDVSQFHHVKNTKNRPRKLFKLSFFDDSYLDVCRNLNKYQI